MEVNRIGQSTKPLSQVAFGLAAVQLAVALGVAVLPASASSEGGPIAALLYAGYYAVPLAVLGLGLRANGRIILALVGTFSLGLVILHTAPLLTLQRPFQELAWQQSMALVLSMVSGVVEAMIFVVAFAKSLGPSARRVLP